MKYLLFITAISLVTLKAHAQNVGIGTANPVFKLDVKNGSINTDSVYRIGATTVLAVPEVGNLFVGKDAGIINTGSYNTFSGNLAGSSNATGNSNSFFGQTAGYVNTTGDHNSFFGRSTGSSNTTGISNSFYGRSAAYANTTGNYNTAIGNSSLTTNITGTLNTALGYNANVNTGVPTNATAIGANARVDCDNCLVLGSVNGINGASSGVNVGIGTTSPNASAALDVSSTTKGALMPRMTTAQRDAIASPAAGLQIYNLDNNCLEIWNTVGWLSLCADRILFNGIPTIGCVNSWTEKTDFGGTARYAAAGFSIGNKGYIGTGSEYTPPANPLIIKKDFWSYDPITNAWTQKADFGGTARRFAVGFSIGSKGYIGTGYDGAYKKDFWEYDPASNVWTQKTDFGGTARYSAVGFSISSKGYIGTGIDGANTKDFWEYDPATNTWTQKTDFGGTARRTAVGLSIGAKGYIGTGFVVSIGLTKDFWEYDPVSNTWTQKADLGGILSTERSGATGFSIGSKGYIGTSSVGNDFWEYDPGSNTWTLKDNFGGTQISGATGFSIGSKGYIGTGLYLGSNNSKDFREYCQ